MTVTAGLIMRKYADVCCTPGLGLVSTLLFCRTCRHCQRRQGSSAACGAAGARAPARALAMPPAQLPQDPAAC